MQDFARELLSKREDKNCPIIGVFNDVPILLKKNGDGVTINDICNELLGF